MGSDKLLKTTTTSFFPPDNISSPVPFFRKAFTALKPNVITFVKKQEAWQILPPLITNSLHLNNEKYLFISRKE